MILANSTTFVSNPANNTSFCQMTGNAFGFPDFSTNTFYNKMVELIDSATYVIVTSSGTAAGTLDVQTLQQNNVWVGTGTTPTNAPAQIFPWTIVTSTTIRGSLTIPNSSYCPCLGLRFITSGLVGVSITYAQLTVTWR